MNILDQIVLEKKNFIKYLKQKELHTIKIPKKKSLFKKSIIQEIQKQKNALIVEFKRFSPSVKNFNKIRRIQDTIEIYDKSKCCCISILTDKNFGGSLNDISIAKKLTNKPIIRKDFIIDKTQILESKLYGADAILLIAKILTRKQIEDLYQYANELNLDVLIEIESIHEISKIKNIKNSLIGTAGYPITIELSGISFMTPLPPPIVSNRIFMRSIFFISTSCAQVSSSCSTGVNSGLSPSNASDSAISLS